MLGLGIVLAYATCNCSQRPCIVNLWYSVVLDVVTNMLGWAKAQHEASPVNAHEWNRQDTELLRPTADHGDIMKGPDVEN